MIDEFRKSSWLLDNLSFHDAVNPAGGGAPPSYTYLRTVHERPASPSKREPLERSGVATVDEDQLTAADSYDTPYAVRQHEEIDYRHDAGRTAKYLEDPMNEQADTVAELIAAQVRRALP